MAAKVYFARLKNGSTPYEQAQKTKEIFDAAGAEKCISPGDFVAIKVHVGEKNNITHMHPEIARAVVEKVKENEGLPFLTETSTLYKGERENAIKHIMHAHRRGFGIDQVGAPFIMADGLAGNTEIEVEINGELNKTVKIAREIRLADAMVIISHPTGHMLTALGACIKNLGMGLASRMGKMRQHSSMKPTIKESKCRLCGKCIEWCPENIIEERGSSAFINSEKCIGCGECLAVCRFGAVEYNFGRDSVIVQKEMAEHAYGVIKGKEDKCFFINVLVNMTKDCDCLDKKQEKIISDIGILGSFDPVAIDKATLDLTAEANKRNLAEVSYGKLNAMHQLEHAARIGMGSLEYTLVEI
ncbi:MAG: 4Fe-4S ferredoxin, iron-sulfur binding domain protein [Clostridia bacterium 41_269]|nr:MAG: 4Fe-4S ferredoxin, iron-sulfur binding domain protein [Clostridia bacterium 41_269]